MLAGAATRAGVFRKICGVGSLLPTKRIGVNVGGFCDKAEDRKISAVGSVLPTKRNGVNVGGFFDKAVDRKMGSVVMKVKVTGFSISQNSLKPFKDCFTNSPPKGNGDGNGNGDVKPNKTRKCGSPKKPRSPPKKPRKSSLWK